MANIINKIEITYAIQKDKHFILLDVRFHATEQNSRSIFVTQAYTYHPVLA